MGSLFLPPGALPQTSSQRSSMACGLLLPTGAAAAALWPRLLLLPVPCRSSATKEQQHRVPCMNQFDPEFLLNAVRSHRSRRLVCCTSSGSSAEVAAPSRPAIVSTAHSDLLSTGCCMDSVPGALIIISGYWIGPDVDDGCGNVEAMLQRIT
uniref:Uncharacterized protein n=1 Tax=Arundo donax TaxID=35708 RepID=A0A0A8YXG9_ARUDO